MMIRGPWSKASAALLLTASAFALSTASATAADLGGDCCADLEERIAELEATTARKGNRKVSLEITGWVNEAAFFWDDGTESNVYIGTNSLEQSRVNFNGKAKINGDWSAGYRLELGIAGNPSSGFTQDDDNAGTQNAITVRHSHWYLQSKTFGKFAVGLNGTATYHLLDDADGVNTRNYSDPEAAMVGLGGFFLRSGGALVNGGRGWGNIASGSPNNDTFGQNGRRNVVRYDSPEFAGFTVTGSWGEDDQAGAALTYKGKLGDFALLGKVGYEHNTDDATTQCNSITLGGDGGEDCQWYGAAGTILHEPTGLFIYGAWSEQDDDDESNRFAAADGKDRLWYIQAGIERKFFELGKTTIFGEYRQDDRGSNSSFGAGADSSANNFQGTDLQSADLDFWAAGVVQGIDNAAMDLYVIYRHAEGDLKLVNGTKTELDDMDMVITGARIKF